MNGVLIVLAILLALTGLLGAVVPGLPGPPIAWLALLMIQLSSAADHAPWFIVVMALAAALVTVLDYVVPSWGAKRYGGSKAGVWGCNIGLVVSLLGLPLGPQGLVGVFFWPFLGAWVGELAAGKSSQTALRAAWGTFLGMLSGIFIKLIYALVVAVVLVKDLIS
ncbi:MAG: hypothetical protein AUK63_302 [bacterium P3]|nr:MAG: hypothetical protein AUK63_302 [bacterium P3]KWW42737.1 MAG: hypothetical protein F083_141 [bacterium F083]